MNNKLIGAHVSTAQGLHYAPERAAAIGAKAMAIFTGNPSRWHSKPISDAEANAFKQACDQFGFTPDRILPHDGFLINLGSPDHEKLQRSRQAFIEELRRCQQLGLTMLNFHPGSHLNLMEVDKCLDLIAQSINIALEATSSVKAVIETTAGQGSNLGYRFEQVARIIDGVDDKERIGVCVDTCHSFAAGYDLSTPEGYEATWREFDSVIGLNRLCGLHLNDSKKGLGCKVDRHAPIGQGALGSTCFSLLMRDPRMDGIPMILETPDDSIWADEIAWLYSQADLPTA